MGDFEEVDKPADWRTDEKIARSVPLHQPWLCTRDMWQKV